MRVNNLRQAFRSAGRDGRVTSAEVDAVMLKVRDAGGLDATERAEVLRAADGFDDVAKQRVLMHVAAMSQPNAWVNVEAVGQLAQLDGRYATMTVGVPGLSARVGLFDNAFALRGRATANGTLTLKVDGHSIRVEVKRGEPAAAVLERVRAQLPQAFTGLTFGGDVQPYEPARFEGRQVSRTDTAAHLMLYKPAALGLRPGEKPLRVVVTGYGAFMGITDNPSANMANLLAQRGITGAIVEYRRLDVTPKAVDAFMEEMKRSKPDVILSMGVTGGQAQVEERPNNALDAAPDGNNVMMEARPVRAGGPAELATDLPVETIDWALGRFGAERAVHTSASDASYSPDRSAYLCNYLGYNLASAFGTTPDTTAGFMHINASTPVEQMHAVLEAVVAKHLDQRRSGPLPRS